MIRSEWFIRLCLVISLLLTSLPPLPVIASPRQQPAA
jgi:hypothetical protein